MPLFQPVPHISSEEAGKRMQAALDTYWKVRFSESSPAAKSLARDVAIAKLVELGYSEGQAAKYTDRR